MPAAPRKLIRNHLLAALGAEDYEIVSAEGEAVPLQRRDVLIAPHRPVSTVHFIESGVVSEVATTLAGRRIEIGIIGNEGFVGVPVLLDVDSTPHEVCVRMEGEALRLDSTVFRDLVERRPGLRRLLSRYAHVFQLQTADTVLSSGIRTLEERLARWLLMCHDRIAGDELPVTHEALSMMLGVRRPGVTTALHALEGAGMIKGRRSHIRILDRETLKSAAGEGYGMPEREYQRLIGAGR